MQSSTDWVGLAIIAVVLAALGFGARLASNGWIKSSLRWTFYVALLVVGAVLLWNLTVLFLARREG
jgi:hypothetical protein